VSNRATTYVYDFSPYKGAGFALHVAVADSVNDEHDDRFWMCPAKLAAKARVARETASRWLWQAVEDGFLEVVDDRRAGHNESSEFRFLAPDAERVYDPKLPLGRVISDHTPRDLRSHPRDLSSHPPVISDHLSPSTHPKKNPRTPLGAEAAPAKRRTRIPDDFELDLPMATAASKVGLHHSRHEFEFAQFRDHHAAKGSLMADWPAAWRTWARNAVKFSAGPARRGTPADPAMPRHGTDEWLAYMQAAAAERQHGGRTIVNATLFEENT
jgi:hypothetical protein